MFINLTNHSSTNWSKKQRKAAEVYGQIIDMPFPVIKPTFTKEDILSLVSEYTDRIVGMQGENKVVHVMGEMTFTHNVVNALKDVGITCIASTTERNTIITLDSKKISEFKFVQFREY
jgi:hypothetical protein